MTSVGAPVRTYRQFAAAATPARRLRTAARDAAVVALSRTRSVPTGNWLRFPYYHHVFDDERKRFAAHLRYFGNLGDIVSLDEAVDMLESPAPLQGRFFCITFDDGLRNCVTNAVPILVDHGATAAFFLPTAQIDASTRSGGAPVAGFYDHGDVALEFLTWDECREMASAGMTLGSHSVSHPVLSALTESEAKAELRESKEAVEREVRMPCEHFACPTGRPGVDFDPGRDPMVARRLGYRSFSTTQRGSAGRRCPAMLIERDHAIAAWSTSQLRYFLSR